MTHWIVAGFLLISAMLQMAAASGDEISDRLRLDAERQSRSAPPRPVPGPSVMLPNFDPDTIFPVLEELGFDVIGAITPDGRRLLFVRSDNDLRFVILPMACRGGEKTDCKAAALIAMFRGRASRDMLNSFNYRYPFAHAGEDPSGVTYLSRYELADHGLVKGNFVISIDLFLQRSDKLRSALNTVSRSVRLDPLSGRVSSASGPVSVAGPDIAKTVRAGPNHDALDQVTKNQRKIDKNTRLQDVIDPRDVIGGSDLERSDHLIAIESVGRSIELLIEADAANPGKIINPLIEGRPERR